MKPDVLATMVPGLTPDELKIIFRVHSPVLRQYKTTMIVFSRAKPMESYQVSKFLSLSRQ